MFRVVAGAVARLGQVGMVVYCVLYGCYGVGVVAITFWLVAMMLWSVAGAVAMIF